MSNENVYICDNCGKKWTDKQIEANGGYGIRDFWGRVNPGEVMPACECLDCGALCHPDWIMEAPLARFAPKDKPTDYTLQDGFTSCWITVKDLYSVYLHITDEGMVVDLFKKGEEMEAPLSSTYAYDSEAEGDDNG